jgi:polyisoprenoid-binding protein YceI
MDSKELAAATAVTVKMTPVSLASNWELDPAHSSVQFSVRHMMISKVHGAFSKVTASLTLDRALLANSKITASIEAASIDTREAKRDEHLRSAEFFDVTVFPTLTFSSKRLELMGSTTDQYLLTGDLTMHGITREIILTVESSASEMKDPYGRVKIGASATAKLNRKDFGLGWNAALETGGLLVGEEVSITLDLQFIRKD